MIKFMFALWVLRKMEPTMKEQDQESPIEVVYEKDKKREEAEEKISDILSEAIYSYMIKKNLRGRSLGGR